MTQEELDALPEIGGIAYRDNGDGTRTPYMTENFVMDQTGLETFMVTDLRGTIWMLGKVNGRLCKRQIRLSS